MLVVAIMLTRISSIAVLLLVVLHVFCYVAIVRFTMLERRHHFSSYDSPCWNGGSGDENSKEVVLLDFDARKGEDGTNKDAAPTRTSTPEDDSILVVQVLFIVVVVVVVVVAAPIHLSLILPTYRLLIETLISRFDRRSSHPDSNKSYSRHLQPVWPATTELLQTYSCTAAAARRRRRRQASCMYRYLTNRRPALPK